MKRVLIGLVCALVGCSGAPSDSSNESDGNEAGATVESSQPTKPGKPKTDAGTVDAGADATVAPVTDASTCEPTDAAPIVVVLDASCPVCPSIPDATPVVCPVVDAAPVEPADASALVVSFPVV